MDVTRPPSLRQTSARKLTAKQKGLVDTLVAKGCSVREACKDAGYAPDKGGTSTGYRALKLPHVQQYMNQRVMEQIGLSAARAVNQVHRLAGDAKSEYVKLEASKDILDRAGFKPVDRSQVQFAGDIKVSIDLG